MKKLVLGLISLVAFANAEVIVGTELFYGKVDSEVTASGSGGSASFDVDTKTIGMAIKAGYQWESVRALAYVSSERYRDDVVVGGEGNLIAYGAELDYIMPYDDQIDIYIGGTIGTGEKDFGDIGDYDFNEYGVRVGGTYALSDGLALETGIQYKKRDYDTYSEPLYSIDIDERIIGVYIGINFML